MKFRPVVIANWKMNPQTPAEAKKLFSKIKKAAGTLKRTDVIVAPSFAFIPLLKVANKKTASRSTLRSIVRSHFSLGAQDVSSFDMGAHTGEVSAGMLASLSVASVIVGHSERRKAGDTNAIVNQKLRAVLGSKMKAIVCIGEETHDKDGEYLSFLRTQIAETFTGLSRGDLANIIIAYEPIWAIGSASQGAMEPNDLHQTTLYIQKVLSEIFTRDIANLIPIIYGGSVDESNAGSLLENGNVKGFLVGRASLALETFLPILKASENIH